MTKRAWRVLVIDDNPEMTDDAARELHDQFDDDPQLNVEILVENSFSHGFQRVKRDECDIVVLDVRRERTDTAPEERDIGRHVYTDIQEVRFLPIIFWTALPQEVNDLRMPPLVEVFPKEDLNLVPAAIRAAIDSGTADVMAKIEQSVAIVMRDHLWKELAPHWDEDTVGGRPEELALILITRVAQALQDQALPELTNRPSHCYLYPPVSSRHRPGDLLRDDRTTESEWWVVLTPACDLEHDGKADFALLGRASLLTMNLKYTAWVVGQTKGKWNELEDMLKGKNARYHYLPEFRDIPDLLLDLERTQTIPVAELAHFTRVASLISPYSEAILAKHSHFRGRIGIPDLNSASVKRRLASSAAPEVA